MITAEGGNKDWFSERAFHPITADEHKGSPSKLPAAESLTYLEEGGREGSQAISACRPKLPVRCVQLLSPPALSCVLLTLSFLIRQSQLRVEALLIGHPSKTHTEPKLLAIDLLSLSCAAHHFQHKAQAAWHKL